MMGIAIRITKKGPEVEFQVFVNRIYAGTLRVGAMDFDDFCQATGCRVIDDSIARTIKEMAEEIKEYKNASKSV